MSRFLNTNYRGREMLGLLYGFVGTVVGVDYAFSGEPLRSGLPTYTRLAKQDPSGFLDSNLGYGLASVGKCVVSGVGVGVAWLPLGIYKLGQLQRRKE